MAREHRRAATTRRRSVRATIDAPLTAVRRRRFRATPRSSIPTPTACRWSRGRVRSPAPSTISAPRSPTSTDGAATASRSTSTAAPPISPTITARQQRRAWCCSRSRRRSVSGQSRVLHRRRRPRRQQRLRHDPTRRSIGRHQVAGLSRRGGARPGSAPVSSPSRVTTVPFTTLAAIPTGSATRRVPPAGMSDT